MKTIIKSIILLSALILYGCEDIILEDISNDTIIVNYPKNSEKIESNVVNFQWEKLEGAEGYRVQIYSLNNNMILDSLTVSNNFIHTVNPGTYRWRVRGENSAYSTEYSMLNDFIMIETDDLTDQKVILLSPETNFYTKSTAPLFSWSKVNAASSYTFQLINNTTNTMVYEEDDVQELSLSLANSLINEDGKYVWKVKAVNSENDTESDYSSRILYIDRTAPAQPQNVLPENNGTRQDNDQINFSWSVLNDTGVVSSAVVHTIQIAADQNFANIIETNTSSNTSYSYSFISAGIYYWRIRSTDLAGNDSTYSTYFKITIQ